MGAQAILIRRPASLLVQDDWSRRTPRRCSSRWCLALLALGSRRGDPPSSLFGALILAVTAWPAVAAMQTARTHRSDLRGVASPAVLLACLSFDVRTMIANRVRSFGAIAFWRRRSDRRSRRRRYADRARASAKVARLHLGGAMASRRRSSGSESSISTCSAKLRASVLRRTAVHGAHPASSTTMLMTQRLTPAVRALFHGELTARPHHLGSRPGERLAPRRVTRYLAAPTGSAVGTMIGDARWSASSLAIRRTCCGNSGKAWPRAADRRRDRAPLDDRAELRRRWTHFTHATATIGTGLPPSWLTPGAGVPLRTRRRDPVRRPRPRRAVAVSQSEGRLPARAAPRRMPMREPPASGRDVEAFMREHLPLVAVSDLDRGARLIGGKRTRM